MTEVTRILAAIEQGDPQVAEQLLPLVYDELRRLAAQKLAREKPGQTLQATALVHEAYLRLVDVKKAQHWNSRGHFFAAAAEAMRRILVDQARRKRAEHARREQRVELSDADGGYTSRTRASASTTRSTPGRGRSGGRPDDQAPPLRRHIDRGRRRGARHLPHRRLPALGICAGSPPLPAEGE